MFPTLLKLYEKWVFSFILVIPVNPISVTRVGATTVITDIVLLVAEIEMFCVLIEVAVEEESVHEEADSHHSELIT